MAGPSQERIANTSKQEMKAGIGVSLRVDKGDVDFARPSVVMNLKSAIAVPNSMRNYVTTGDFPGINALELEGISKETRAIMNHVLMLIGLLCVLPQVALGADRLAELDLLVAEYEAAKKKFYEAPLPKKPTTAEKIRRHEAWPLWQYIPRVVELAEDKPDDEAAFRCCQWIIDRTGNVGNLEKTMFDADQKAWAILAAHHTEREDLPMLCFRAVKYDGPAQEQFLRGLLMRADLSRERMGFATVALAELLAHKHDRIGAVQRRRQKPQDEFTEYYFERRKSPDWGKDLIPENAAKFKAEGIQLFREVLARYADVPVTISAPYFRDLTNLGEKASKGLHGLEHLTIGSELSNIVGSDLHGRPLDMSVYRGSVVVISTWFTGCGPCMAMIPQEQRLIETYKDRPFVLLGVCTDETLEQAQKTAAEHKMDWPCWFDGANGPILRDLNILRWPTIYVLDRDGRIAAKNIRGEDLDVKVAELMEESR